MTVNQIHVVPENETNRWRVERADDNQPLSKFKAKEEAVAVGRKIAEEKHLKPVIHDSHEGIQEKDSPW
jgi:hypothetical protein